jgi:hypothetical protein
MVSMMIYRSWVNRGICYVPVEAAAGPGFRDQQHLPRGGIESTYIDVSCDSSVDPERLFCATARERQSRQQI